MPITATQLEQRKARIGSSDMSKILGVDPFGNAYDVWLEKTGKLEAEAKGSDAARMGTLLEPAVLQYAEEELGKLTRNQFRSAKDLGFPLGANIDAIVVATGEPVEAKTSGLQRGFPFENWGDPLTDQVPDRVIVQAMVHLICLVEIHEVCHVPTLLGGRGFDRFVVPFDADVANAIKEEGYKFWHNHVLADVPPDNLTPNLAVLKRVRREPSKVIAFDDEAGADLAMWLTLCDQRKLVEKQEKEWLAKVLTNLGDAEAATCEMGTFNYLEQSRSSFDAKALKERLPIIYDEYSDVTRYRVARFKKAK